MEALSFWLTNLYSISHEFSQRPLLGPNTTVLFGFIFLFFGGSAYYTSRGYLILASDLMYNPE